MKRKLEKIAQTTENAEIHGCSLGSREQRPRREEPSASKTYMKKDALL